ncbi:MAG: hypothetical protein AAFV25_23315 [Bacteroidota bacterium]
MKHIKKKIQSFNFVTNILTAVLGMFVASGLQIDAVHTADQLYDHIINENWGALVIMATLQLLNPVIHWIKQLKKDPSQFWQFLKSINWWTNVATIVSMYAIYKGVQIPEDAGEQVVRSIFEQRWEDLLKLLAINVLNPLIQLFIKRKPGSRLERVGPRKVVIT